MDSYELEATISENIQTATKKKKDLNARVKTRKLKQDNKANDQRKKRFQ